MRRRGGAGQAPLLRRYAPLAAVVNDFYFALHTESRKTPYPRAAIAEQLARAGVLGN
ncbi:hypothetical protein [Amycolatopsis plumensis]|uniref:Uncharacterized protein n=1 Tax=Amycolatopsis plumensis TaxID=236508 RepID=A0ABV5UC53_9PSEU